MLEIKYLNDSRKRESTVLMISSPKINHLSSVEEHTIEQSRQTTNVDDEEFVRASNSPYRRRVKRRERTERLPIGVWNPEELLMHTRVQLKQTQLGVFSAILHACAVEDRPPIKSHADVDRESQKWYSHCATSVFSDRNRMQQVLLRQRARSRRAPATFVRGFIGIGLKLQLLIRFDLASRASAGKRLRWIFDPQIDVLQKSFASPLALFAGTSGWLPSKDLPLTGWDSFQSSDILAAFVALIADFECLD
ncbi:hypothetical protein BT69DRAFT_1316388 [Atractiella rhizophila]|nr:hypothetical protein BT69DRAFT_1316388 [Atractiella rhizophila]